MAGWKALGSKGSSFDSTNLDGTGLDWTGTGTGNWELERRGVSGPQKQASGRPDQTRPGPRSSTSRTQQLWSAIIFSADLLERGLFPFARWSAPPDCVALPLPLPLPCLALPLEPCFSRCGLFVAWAVFVVPRLNLLCCCFPAALLLQRCPDLRLRSAEMQQLGAWVEAQVPGGGSAWIDGGRRMGKRLEKCWRRQY